MMLLPGETGEAPERSNWAGGWNDPCYLPSNEGHSWCCVGIKGETEGARMAPLWAGHRGDSAGGVSGSPGGGGPSPEAGGGRSSLSVMAGVLVVVLPAHSCQKPSPCDLSRRHCVAALSVLQACGSEPGSADSPLVLYLPPPRPAPPAEMLSPGQV